MYLPKDEPSGGSLATISMPTGTSTMMGNDKLPKGISNEPMQSAVETNKKPSKRPPRPVRVDSKSETSDSQYNALWQQDLRILTDRFSLLESRVANHSMRRDMVFENLKLKLEWTMNRNRQMEEELIAIAEDHSKKLNKMNNLARALERGVNEKEKTAQDLDQHLVKCRDDRNRVALDLQETLRKVEEVGRQVQQRKIQQERQKAMAAAQAVEKVAPTPPVQEKKMEPKSDAAPDRQTGGTAAPVNVGAASANKQPVNAPRAIPTIPQTKEKKQIKQPLYEIRRTGQPNESVTTPTGLSEQQKEESTRNPTEKRQSRVVKVVQTTVKQPEKTKKPANDQSRNTKRKSSFLGLFSRRSSKNVTKSG